MKTKFKLEPSGNKACPYPTPSVSPNPNSEVAVDVPVTTTLDISPNPVAVAVENVDSAVDESVVADVVPPMEDISAVTETPAVEDASTIAPAEVVETADNSIDAPAVVTTNDPVINTLDDGTVTVFAMDSGDMFASSGTSAVIPFDDTANPVVAPASIDGSANSDITGAAPMVGTDESIALSGDGNSSDGSLAAVSLFPADPAMGNSSDVVDADSSMGASTMAADPNGSLVDPNVTAVDPMTGATDESMLALI